MRPNLWCAIKLLFFFLVSKNVLVVSDAETTWSRRDSWDLKITHLTDETNVYKLGRFSSFCGRKTTRCPTCTCTTTSARRFSVGWWSNSRQVRRRGSIPPQLQHRPIKNTHRANICVGQPLVCRLALETDCQRQWNCCALWSLHFNNSRVCVLRKRTTYFSRRRARDASLDFVWKFVTCGSLSGLIAIELIARARGALKRNPRALQLRTWPQLNYLMTFDLLN